MFPLTHPSWRSKLWMKRHPWFAAEVLPALRRAVADSLDRSEQVAVSSGMLLLLAACGSPAAFDAITGTPPSNCDALYDDSIEARDRLLLLRDDLETCTEPCPELSEELQLAMLQYAQAFDDWWACAGGGW